MEFKKIITFSKKEKSVVQKIKDNGIDDVFNYIDENKKYFYKIAWAYVGNNDDIEDIFQNTIVKVNEHIGELKNEEYFKTWVTSILINECRKILRDKRRIEPDEGVGLDDIKNDCYDLHTIENNMDLKNALNKLEDGYKEVIILKYYGGYSQEEIADVFDMPIGTVKSRIYRGLKMLKSYLTTSETVIPPSSIYLGKQTTEGVKNLFEVVNNSIKDDDLNSEEV